MGYFAPRQAETTLKCDKCFKPLQAKRSCHEVILSCPHCGATFPLSAYIARADTALEKFLENLYMDRI